MTKLVININISLFTCDAKIVGWTLSKERNAMGERSKALNALCICFPISCLPCVQKALSWSPCLRET